MNYLDRLVTLGVFTKEEANETDPSDIGLSEVIDLLAYHVCEMKNVLDNPLLDIKKMFPDEYDFILMEVIGEIIVRLNEGGL